MISVSLSLSICVCLPFKFHCRSPPEDSLLLPCLCHQQVSSWCVEARRTRFTSVLLTCQLTCWDLHSSDCPEETAEKTLGSKELKPGRSGVGKSARRNLSIKITTTQDLIRSGLRQTGNPQQQASFRNDYRRAREVVQLR